MKVIERLTATLNPSQNRHFGTPEPKLSVSVSKSEQRLLPTHFCLEAEIGFYCAHGKRKVCRHSNISKFGCHSVSWFLTGVNDVIQSDPYTHRTADLKRHHATYRCIPSVSTRYQI